MNVVDFCTGQLFDWFFTADKAAPLIERLPSNVTGNTSNPNCPGATHVGREKMYTQFIKEIPVKPGVPHRMEITFQRQPSGDVVGDVPPRRQAGREGPQRRHPARPSGRAVHGRLSVARPGRAARQPDQLATLAHGLFSVVDAFPFQHPEAPELAVSIPVSQRIFGQGAIGSWDDFTVVTKGATGPQE